MHFLLNPRCKLNVFLVNGEQGGLIWRERPGFWRISTDFIVVPASELKGPFHGCFCASPQPYDSLPTSQTCFFQLRLPPYSSQAVMAERLRYAINNCRSIDMDNYMLSRNVDNAEGSDTDYWCRRFRTLQSRERPGTDRLIWTSHKPRDASSSMHQL